MLFESKENDWQGSEKKYGAPEMVRDVLFFQFQRSARSELLSQDHVG